MKSKKYFIYRYFPNHLKCREQNTCKRIQKLTKQPINKLQMTSKDVEI